MDEIGNVCPARPLTDQLGPQPHEPFVLYDHLDEITRRVTTFVTKTGLHLCKHCGCLYWAKGLQP